MLPVNKIICGAMPEATKGWPGESVNCCISSPPYWALRDYGIEGQLGLEPTFEEYIDKLCTIYDEVKRLLRKDGTCFVNLGDTYNSSGTKMSRYFDGRENNPEEIIADNKIISKNLPIKSLCLIPQRFAIEMVNRGWILRNVIIWAKPNPMPSSAKDRFTVDFEYVYFFVKSKKYWFEPQYEPHIWAGRDKRSQVPGGVKSQGKCSTGQYATDKVAYGPLGRNKRCVWTIPTQPYSEAHFATFPEKLVEPMIKAGCPEFICTKCGKAREKIWDKGDLVPDEPQYKPRGRNKPEIGVKTAMTPAGSKQGHPNFHYEQNFKGYTDCGCGADFRPGIMLDPFVVRARLVRSLPN